LPSAVLSRMESALGHEFGGVRLHVGAEADKAAKEIQARAFAVGRDLFFASGEFSPGSEKGDEIIAHELTHVIQYDEGRLDGKSGVSSPYDSEEREADASAAAAVDYLTSVGSSGGGDTLGPAGESLGGDVDGPAASAPESATEAVSDAGLVARKDAPGAAQPKGEPPSKVDPVQAPTVQAPTSTAAAPKVVAGANAKGPDAKAPGSSKAAPGGAAGAADTQARSFKDLVGAAVAKAPKVVQCAATNLKQAEKKLPDDPSAVRSKLPDLLKSRFKPVVEPLVPHKPGEAVSLEALVGVVGTMVTALPELVKHAGADAEADAKDKKDKQKTDAKSDGKNAGKGGTAPPTQAPSKPAATPSVTPHEPGKDPAKADPKQADAADDTTQFFVTAIAEALAALCPVPPPAAKDEDAKDPALLNGPKVAVDPLNPSHPKAKEPDKAVDPKAAADEKAYKKQQLKWEIEGLKNDEERITRTRDGLSQQVAAIEVKIKAATTEMDTRRVYLEHQAAVAKKRGKKTKPLNKDSRLRQLQHGADELPKEVARLKAEMERVEKELAAAVEKREKDEEALRAIEAEAAAHAGGGGGGGGVHIPPPTDFVATSKAVLAALQPKEKKLKTDADKAKADWQKLKDEVTTLEGNVKKGNEDLAALQKKKDGHVAEVTRLEGLKKSRTAFLNTPGKDGAPAPGTSGDATLEGYISGISKANAARIEINKQITDLGRQLKTWNDQLHTKKIALEAAEEKKTTTENATTNFATAVKSLQDVQGCPNWQMIVNDYKLSVKATPVEAQPS